MGKRVLLLAVLSVFSLTLFAQSSKSIDGRKIVYIMTALEGESKFKQTAVIYYDHIMLNKNESTAYRLKDETGKYLRFGSKLGLVNYLTLQGWTLMSNVSEIYGQVAGWMIFAKEVTESEANEILPKLAEKVDIETGKSKK